MERPGKAWEDSRHRRYGPSVVLTSSAAVGGDTVKPMPQTLLLAVLHVSLARDVQLRTKGKVKPSKKPVLIFFLV